MTRFDADDPQARRKLFAEAIAAHRARASPFLTIEADSDRDDESEDDPGVEAESDPDVDGRDEPAPWLQFSESTFNLDVEDDELDRLKDLIESFPEFRIDQIESPEEAEGTNVRVTARSDANRLAAFADQVFLGVYGREEDYRAWVAAV
jgi:hypothetical protein